MRTKVEAKDIFGSTSAVNNDTAANTEVKEAKKTTRKATSTKATSKKPVKETAAKKQEEVTAKVNEVKSELEEKKEELKSVVEEAKAAVREETPKKRGRKPAATKTTAAKKSSTVKKDTESKKAAEKTTAKAVRKISAKKAFNKELFFQFEGKQVDEDTLVARITEDAKSQNVEIKDLKMYLKPEDNACYYVVNGNVAGKVDLY